MASSAGRCSSLVFGLMLLAVGTRLAHGASYVITGLNDGGSMVYLTSPNTLGGSPYFGIGASNTQTTQHWYTTGNYPTSFGLYAGDGSLSLDNGGGKLTLQKTNASATSQIWIYDSYGRLTNSLGSLVIQATLSANGYISDKATATLVPRSPASTAQQFVFFPDVPAVATGAIGYLGTLTGNPGPRHCLDAGTKASLAPGEPNTPTLTVCSASTTGQQTVTLSPVTVTGGAGLVFQYPTLFQIQFPSTGLCLGASQSFNANASRADVTLMQIACNQTWSETAWSLTTRGQLQSFLELPFGSNGGVTYVCLNVIGALLAPGPCSFATVADRWIFQ